MVTNISNCIWMNLSFDRYISRVKIHNRHSQRKLSRTFTTFRARIKESTWENEMTLRKHTLISFFIFLVFVLSCCFLYSVSPCFKLSITSQSMCDLLACWLAQLLERPSRKGFGQSLDLNNLFLNSEVFFFSGIPVFLFFWTASCYKLGKYNFSFCVFFYFYLR